MKIRDPIKLVSQLLDLPIIDKDERWCGIVDDVELVGSTKTKITIEALLVGPGAYEGRMPRWLFALVGKIASHRMTRIPIADVAEIDSAVKLRRKAEELDLHRVEDQVRSWIPRVGAM
jgi:hypothetical protein